MKKIGIPAQKPKRAKRKRGELSEEEEERVLTEFMRLAEEETKVYNAAKLQVEETRKGTYRGGVGRIYSSTAFTASFGGGPTRKEEDFRQARKKEISHKVKHVVFSFRPVDPKSLPPNTKCLRVIPIHSYKRNGVAKGRIIVLGKRTTAGVHFNETYAALLGATSIRSMFAIAAQCDLESRQGDVNIAFLGTEIDGEIYVTMPKELSEKYCRHFEDSSGSDNGENGGVQEMTDDSSDTRVHKLLKAAPGLPQSMRLFKGKVDRSLLKFGIKPLAADSSTYRYKEVCKQRPKSCGAICRKTFIYLRGRTRQTVNVLDVIFTGTGKPKCLCGACRDILRTSSGRGYAAEQCYEYTRCHRFRVYEQGFSRD